MQGDPKVIAALEAALAASSHLNIQYRADWRTTKFNGVKKVAKKLHGLGSDLHHWTKKFSDQVLLLGGSVSYAPSEVVSKPTLTDIFENELALEYAMKTPQEQAIQTAMAAMDDPTRNLFEHSLKASAKRIGWLEQQLRLIKAMGEDEYVAEKM
jgi:bacterioferritin